MSQIMYFAVRNMNKYFRDKTVVGFSLISVFIVIGLYVFVLADMQIENINGMIPGVVGVDEMVYTWIIGGLLFIPAVSVPMIVLCFKVDDYVKGVEDDLFVTPTDRVRFLIGYNLAAWFVGFIMTVITFIICEVFIVVKGGNLLAFDDMLKVMGILLGEIIAFSGPIFFIIIFLKTNSSLTVLNSILNTVLGFLLGIFVPIGMLNDSIGNIIKAIPLIQMSAMVRRIVMGNAIDKVFLGAPDYVINEVRSMYGLDIYVGEHLMRPWETILILAVIGILFYILSGVVLNIRKRV